MLSYYLSLLIIGFLFLAELIIFKKTGAIKSIMLNISLLIIFPVLLIYSSALASLTIILITSFLLGFVFPIPNKVKKQATRQTAGVKPGISPLYAGIPPSFSGIRQPTPTVNAGINDKPTLAPLESVSGSSDTLQPLASGNGVADQILKVYRNFHYTPQSANDGMGSTNNPRQTNLASETNSADFGGADTESAYEASYKAAGEQPVAVTAMEGGMIEFPSQVYRQPNIAENMYSNVPKSDETVLHCRLLSKHGIKIDNGISMSEFLTDKNNKPGSLSSITSIVKSSSEAVVNEIESHLRILCLTSDDPLISNKGLYAVQFIRKRRGQGDDSQLIAAMIAKEERFMEKVPNSNFVNNY